MSQEKISLVMLARALANNEFVFFYQPVVSLITGKVCGAEALIRWNRADGSLALPSMFIPLAEDSEFIAEISHEMFPKLVADIKAIHQFNPSLVIAFNVVVKDLLTDEFVTQILNAIQEQQINPSTLRIELSERQAMNVNVLVQEHISTLAAEGIQIAIDDFGAGYSTVSLLKDLPLTCLKIDQKFVGNIFDSEKSAMITRHSISLAHQFGLETVGEGVESQAIFDYLLCYGCTSAQGYYISVPLPLSDFLAFLSQESQRPSFFPYGLIHLAQQDHLDWMRDLVREVLNAFCTQDEKLKQRAYERIPESDYKKCLLGTWYYGTGQIYHGMASFDSLENAHKRLHEMAEDLVRTARAGAPKEQVAESISTLKHYSSEIIELLQDLHTQAVLEYKLNYHAPPHKDKI